MPINGNPIAKRRPQRGRIRQTAISDSAQKSRYCQSRGLIHVETQLYEARIRWMLSHAGAILSKKGCASVAPAWRRDAINRTTNAHASGARGFQFRRRIAITMRSRQIGIEVGA